VLSVRYLIQNKAAKTISSRTNKLSPV